MDIIDANGLQTRTRNEFVTLLEEGFRRIYGNDINVSSNSPDGQIINIFAQAGIDLRELITQVYNSFDPDNAIGRTLDQRVAINNIARQGGTYTIQPIEIVISETATLQGLDAQFNDPAGSGYTIQDNAGNQFILIDSVTLAPGTHTRNFRARNIGQVQTTINTITTPVTIVLGVVSVNNVTGPLSVGQNEELDSELRIRRQRSVALGSQGYLNGLEAALLNLQGVTEAFVYENNTNSIDARGVPAHGIWAIVEGGSNQDIANAIFQRRNAGADMRGSVEIPITLRNGEIFIIRFDRPVAEDLHIRFDIQPTTGTAFDQAAIKQYIVDNLRYTINQFAETSAITAIARSAIENTGGGGVPVNVEISRDGIAFVDYLEASGVNRQFTLSVGNIDITEI